jgi:hypothetical protein
MDAIFEVSASRCCAFWLQSIAGVVAIGDKLLQMSFTPCPVFSSSS